jgi:CubicO group peptidase (beta-lactamase class C family)
MKLIQKSIIPLCIALVPLTALAVDESAIDGIFEAHDNTGTPGCAMGVYQNGQMVFKKGYGMASLELSVPNSPQHVYYIASTSKQFAAAAIALAALDGKLTFDDPISQYFPELPDYADSIRVRHLVHHTSGLRDYLGLMGMGGWPMENIYSNQWVLDLIARQLATNFVPGEKYSYSNSGYFLMGELIKRVTGQTLRQYTDARIFQPLGMIHTHFHDDRLEIDENRAAAYSPARDGGYELEWYTNFDKVGSGGLFTTVEDLLLWEANFIDDKLGGGKLVETMLKPGVLNSGEMQTYASGLALGKHAGFKTVGHGGAFMGFRAQYLRFPEHNLGISVLCNVSSASPSRLAKAVADLYLADSTDETGGTDGESGTEATATDRDTRIAADMRRKLQGDYQEVDIGIHLPIREKDGGLVLEFMGGEFPLILDGENELSAIGLPYEAHLAFNDEGDFLTLSVAGSAFGKFQKSEAVRTSVSALHEYEGLYFSGELGSNYRIDADDGHLTVQPGFAESLTLKATFADTFEYSDAGMVLVFQRDESGAVNGITVNGFRVLGIGFVKTGN